MLALRQSVVAQRSLSPVVRTFKGSIPSLRAGDETFLRPHASFTVHPAVLFSSCSARIAPLLPRTFPTSGFKTIEPSIKVEEESLSFYDPRLFYPVRLGEVFQERYQVVAKLGYGGHSTIWLCHDLQYASSPPLLTLTPVSKF